VSCSSRVLAYHRNVRAVLIPVLGLYACGAEPPAKKPVPVPVAEVTTTATPVVSASSSASAASESIGSPQDAHRTVRGSLIRSHLAIEGLRAFTKACDNADGGVCRGVDELRAQRDHVAKRLDEAKAFATAHADALPAEPQCLASVLEQADRLAAAMQSHAAEPRERDELAKRIDRCNDSFAATVAAYGAPFPTPSQPHESPRGRIPPEEIQKIVRQNFGRFKLCYTASLAHHPSSGGRTEPEFVIDVDGTIADIRMRSSTVADNDMNACLLRAMASLRFPPPEGGYVTVVYPLIFSPGDQ